MTNNEKLLRLEQVILNEADEILKKETLAELCPDMEDEELVKQAAALLILYAFGMDPGEKAEDREFMHGWLLPSMQRLSPTLITGNEYFKQVRFDERSVGDIALTRLRYEPFQLFPAGEMSMDEKERLKAPLGFFDQRVEYPALLQGGREWMALKPNEIITMQPCIERAHGEVVVMGLGLGYYAHQVCRKKEVRKVTIVEREKETIALFEEQLLPQFEERGKIEIVHGDAIEMMRNHCEGRKVDYIFVDLWHDVGDGLPIYKEIKAIVEDWAGAPEVDFWIERSMGFYL